MKLFLLNFLLFITSCSSYELKAMGNEIIEELPIGKSDGRLLVIIPAKKYSMRKPLFEKIASGASKAGYHVVRFNWRFYTERGAPSNNFKNEIVELNEIIQYYSQKYNYKEKDIVIAAKSFGSRVLAKSKLKTYGLGLMTPNCSEKDSFKETYRNLFNRHEKVQISISINDPYCDIGQIYKEVSNIGSEMSIYTTYGDHNFNNANGELNQDVFVVQFIQWLKNI